MHQGSISTLAFTTVRRHIVIHGGMHPCSRAAPCHTQPIVPTRADQGHPQIPTAAQQLSATHPILEGDPSLAPELTTPALAPPRQQTNSRSEYVRCLALLTARILLVATNRGVLYRVQLPGPDCAEHWTILWASQRQSPITCLVTLPPCDSDSSTCNISILLGEQSGWAALLRVTADAVQLAQSLQWQAHSGGATLSAFCPAAWRGWLGVTCGLAGAVSCWSLPDGKRVVQLCTA